jgi:hypothetical protein
VAARDEQTLQTPNKQPIIKEQSFMGGGNSMYPSSPTFESSTQAENPQAAKNEAEAQMRLLNLFRSGQERGGNISMRT